MIEKVQWICEACDSSNSVEAGELAICRFCRLTYEVKIERASSAPVRDPEPPEIAAAVELMSFEPERGTRNTESEEED